MFHCEKAIVLTAMALLLTCAMASAASIDYVAQSTSTIDVITLSKGTNSGKITFYWRQQSGLIGKKARTVPVRWAAGKPTYIGFSSGCYTHVKGRLLLLHCGAQTLTFVETTRAQLATLLSHFPRPR